MPEKSQPPSPPPAMFHTTPPGSGPIVAVVGDVYRFLATGRETAGRYALWEAIVPPGGGPPLHQHTRESEGFFIISGELTITVGDRRMTAKAGAYVHLEPGTRHCFKNETDQTARMLILIAPAGLEDYFLEVGSPLASVDELPPSPSPAEITRLLAVAPRYGLTIFPPPRA
ncbi:MAG TPA: cupin domain-containing protein [Pirellulales bacterium]|nr:cupin domain-containing protein [Pirellulales bacterium]